MGRTTENPLLLYINEQTRETDAIQEAISILEGHAATTTSDERKERIERCIEALNELIKKAYG